MLDAAFAVHPTLGAGVLESAYKACFVYELRKRGLAVETEVPVPLVYDGTRQGEVGYWIDLLVAGELVVEVKAVETIAAVDGARLVSYLKLANKRLGLLINFNTEHLRDGIDR